MQMTLWDDVPLYKIDKPVRLIELFAGIGSQAKAFELLYKYCGIEYEHHRAVEYNAKAIDSYNAVHGTEFIASDITKITADGLGIVDTDRYDYVMTYSFPCQDLSNAGLRKGMQKDDNTRSGLLWEVERLLLELKDNCIDHYRKECIKSYGKNHANYYNPKLHNYNDNLPHVLLMENVPEVGSRKNIVEFTKWILFLESLGYSNYTQVINSKDYGIPQSRERMFMVSILGEYRYEFPKAKKSQLRLRDILETEVEEKYYLKYSTLIIQETSEFAQGNSATTKIAVGADKCIIAGILDNPHQLEMHNRVFSGEGLCPTLTTQCGGNLEKKILELSGKVRKLTPKEYWRLMGYEDSDYAKVADNSKTALYSQAGNSIVVSVLVAIFGKLYGIDTREIEYVKDWMGNCKYMNVEERKQDNIMRWTIA